MEQSGLFAPQRHYSGPVSWNPYQEIYVFIFPKVSNRRVGNPGAECVQDFHEAQIVSYGVQPRLFAPDERAEAWWLSRDHQVWQPYFTVMAVIVPHLLT